MRVPRVRAGGKEISLRSYDLLHRGVTMEPELLQRVLHGMSCRNYETAMPVMEGDIGTTKSSISRGFVRSSAECRRKLDERGLSGFDLVAILIDGKSFAKDSMVLSLGVDMEGRKHVLGMVQTDTENDRAITEFLRTLVDVRGMNISQGLLVISDGSKGFRSACNNVFKGHFVHQRCQWHKRENVVSYLSKEEQGPMKKRLQHAYDRPTYNEAHAALQKIKKELEEQNQSALKSLEEGYEETLALHRLGVFALVGISLKTTNLIESVNSMMEEACGKVDRWTNSAQKHRWVATALLDIEPRLRRIKGYQHLPKLRAALQKELKIKPKEMLEQKTNDRSLDNFN
jgi:transposase-like protein